MAKAVRVHNDKVVEVFNGDKASLVNKMHPDLLATFLDAPDDVTTNWFYYNDEFSETPPSQPFDSLSVRDETRRRIYAVANETAQMNMNAWASLDLFTEEQRAIYIQGVQWVYAMRAKCNELILNEDVTFKQDSHWPVCPPAAVALAAQF